MTEATNQRIDYSLIPQDCTDLYAALRKAGFPINNLIPEIISDSNMSESFDYVISNLEHNDQRRKYRPKKDQYIKSLKEQIAGGTFRITQKDVTTKQGDGRYLVSFCDPKTGEWSKFFTASEEMKQILDKVSDVEDGFPFLTTISSEVFDGNKVKYRFT